MSDFFAVFKNCEFKCFLKRGGQVELISKTPLEGFEVKGKVFSRIVDRSECDRVYEITPMVRYEGKSYYYYEETEDKIQLFVGDSDLSLEWEPKGFKHTGYEQWTKWVPKSECEKFDEVTEY